VKHGQGVEILVTTDNSYMSIDKLLRCDFLCNFHITMVSCNVSQAHSKNMWERKIYASNLERSKIHHKCPLLLVPLLCTLLLSFFPFFPFFGAWPSPSGVFRDLVFEAFLYWRHFSTVQRNGILIVSTLFNFTFFDIPYRAIIMTRLRVQW